MVPTLIHCSRLLDMLIRLHSQIASLLKSILNLFYKVTSSPQQSWSQFNLHRVTRMPGAIKMQFYWSLLTKSSASSSVSPRQGIHTQYYSLFCKPCVSRSCTSTRCCHFTLFLCPPSLFPLTSNNHTLRNYVLDIKWNIQFQIGRIQFVLDNLKATAFFAFKENMIYFNIPFLLKWLVQFYFIMKVILLLYWSSVTQGPFCCKVKVICTILHFSPG